MGFFINNTGLADRLVSEFFSIKLIWIWWRVLHVGVNVLGLTWVTKSVIPIMLNREKKSNFKCWVWFLTSSTAVSSYPVPCLCMQQPKRTILCS